MADADRRGASRLDSEAQHHVIATARGIASNDNGGPASGLLDSGECRAYTVGVTVTP